MNSKVDSVVVIGAGQAGCQVIDSLRQRGYQGAIHLVGEEAYLPYQRPPLSKKFLSGEVPAARLALRPDAFYEKHDVHTHLGVQALELNPGQHMVALSNGKVLNYDRLALCTGAHVFKLPTPGSELKGIHYLRNIDDVEGIKLELDEARQIVIIGAGFIGLETAAIMAQLGKCQAGCSITVVEMQDRVMGRAVAPEVSEIFQALHTRHGVDIKLKHGVVELSGDKGRIRAIHLSNGEKLRADLCIIGIGILPNVGLAADGGLHCENGIVVDEYALTSHNHIVAAGDCSNHPNPLLGRRLRLESVHNAIEQAKTAAASILGEKVPYRQYPWFWSDQYDVKLQMVGISQGYDTVVVRGDREQQRFSLFYFIKDESANNRLIAVDSINRPADHMQARRLLNQGIAVTPEQAADLDCNLKELQ